MRVLSGRREPGLAARSKAGNLQPSKWGELGVDSVRSVATHGDAAPEAVASRQGGIELLEREGPCPQDLWLRLQAIDHRGGDAAGGTPPSRIRSTSPDPVAPGHRPRSQGLGWPERLAEVTAIGPAATQEGQRHRMIRLAHADRRGRRRRQEGLAAFPEQVSEGPARIDAPGASPFRAHS